MPPYRHAVSGAQQRLMGAALSRKRAGHPRATDPQMSEKDLSEYAKKSRRSLPERKASPARGYGKGPVA